MPIEGTLAGEEQDHKENSPNSGPREDSVVGEWSYATIVATPQSIHLKHVMIATDAMTDMDIQELANLTAGGADVDNFERLFTKLKEMKGEYS